jgi:hypothetical protein
MIDSEYYFNRAETYADRTIKVMNVNCLDNETSVMKSNI